VEKSLKILESLSANYLIKTSGVKHINIDKIEFYAQNLFEKYINKYKWINQNTNHDVLFIFFKTIYFNYNDKISDVLSCFNFYKNAYSEILIKFPFPDYVMLLPAMLSGYNYTHTSEKGAGMWRLQYIVAKRYKLDVDDFIDQRLNPMLSTITALKYLESLMTLYDDNFDYALFAFLSSPVALNNSLANIDDDDDVSFYDNLPKEVILDFHFFKALVLYYYLHENLNILTSFLKYDKKTETVDVRFDFYIKPFILNLDLDSDEFVFLNPELKSKTFQKKTHIVLPSDIAEIFHIKEADLKLLMDSLINDELTKKELIKNTVNETIYHTVKRGETLSQIAAKYDDVTVNEIVRLNGLKSADVIKEGQKLIIKKGK